MYCIVPRHLLLEMRFFGKVVCNVKNIRPSIGMIVLASLEIRPFHDEQLVLSTGGRAVACYRLFLVQSRPSKGRVRDRRVATQVPGIQ